MQFDEPMDEEAHYMNEMRAREENIIKNFLYDPSRGQHREHHHQSSGQQQIDTQFNYPEFSNVNNDHRTAFPNNVYS